MSLRVIRCVSLALLAAVLPCASWADQSGTSTLAPETFLNLETGTNSTSGADLLWDGASLLPQGRAGLYHLGSYGARTFKTIQAHHAAAVPYTTTPIPASALAAGAIFGVRTNSGHYAKVMVTSADGGTLSLEFTTFSATAAFAPAATPAATSTLPTISKLQNNYSYILPGLPNYGIAPGGLFVIFGSNLSTTAAPVLQSSAPPGLPTTLNQTTVSVKVNGVTTTPGLYYTTASAIAAVLPSTTPAGTGTITVTYNGQTSATAPINVVANAVGLDTLYGTGYGAAVVTDTNFNVLGQTNSATPGQTVILWGSGVGADTSNDDRTYPQNSNNQSAVQVFIGGISAKVIYGGRSQYPGLDQFDVVVPSNVSTGCFVSVVVQSGTVVSNAVTMPVNATTGACSDPATGLTGTQIQSLAGKGSGNVNSLALSLVHQVGTNGSTSDFALGLTAQFPSAFFGNGYEYVSQGSCTIVPPAQGNLNFPPLDLGALSVSGPSGTASVTGGGGFYQAQLATNALTKSPGTYTFTGGGGPNIGTFKTSINFQTPLTWTNKAAVATITRSQGATITWTGGFANGDVQINSGIGTPVGTVRFYCHAPSSAGQLVIPASILMAMPPGSGTLEVSNYTAPQTLTATGLDIGFAAGLVINGSGVTFK